MNTNVQVLIEALTPEDMADEIVVLWQRFREARVSWEQEMIELRAFQFATSTRTTEARQPGFKNSTTIPKIAHIASNLRANFNAHLFGNPKWIQFEAFDRDSASLTARKNIEAYARTKASRKDYESVLRTCVDDWLFAGACFAQQRYVTEVEKDDDGNEKILYQGSVLERIPSEDIVFDVTSESFQRARKVIRKVYTLGDIAKLVKSEAHAAFTQQLLDNIRTTRTLVRSSGIVRVPEGVDWKSTALQRDGFGELLEYVNSDLVEVHEFYGDMYSLDTGEFLENHRITVLDRRMIIEKKAMGTNNGSQYLYYATPETRPDNLMGMSPLARLVGMQYKLDKLENMRADIFDMIANPITVELGDAEFYPNRGGVGGKYIVDEQGDVKYLVPDTTILSADFQIDKVILIMEEMAGSPRNASGFRTPGEKTKFEVQVLDNGSNRIFRDRTTSFERTFIEPILNDMIQLAKDNLGEVDLVTTEGEQFNTQEFLAIDKNDLAISGKLRARGSQLFAEKANALQNLMGILGSPAMPLIAPHTSRIAVAKTLEDLGDLSIFNIFIQDIGIQEDQQSARLAQKSQLNTEAAQAVDAMPEGEELDELEEDEEEGIDNEGNPPPEEA